MFEVDLELLTLFLPPLGLGVGGRGDGSQGFFVIGKYCINRATRPVLEGRFSLLRLSPLSFFLLPRLHILCSSFPRKAMRKNQASLGHPVQRGVTWLQLAKEATEAGTFFDLDWIDSLVSAPLTQPTSEPHQGSRGTVSWQPHCLKSCFAKLKIILTVVAIIKIICGHVPACGSVHVSGQRLEPLHPWRWSYRWLGATWHGYWDLNSGSLKDQQVSLSAEPSL